MYLVAEQLPTPADFSETNTDSLNREQPLVISVAELDQDVMIRQRAARFIGRVVSAELYSVLRSEASEFQTERFGSLLEALQAAAGGNSTAIKQVSANVRTDVLERTIKAGLIMEVKLSADKNGNIWQHGQSIEEIQAKSLRYAANTEPMRRRTEAEVRNSFRLKALSAAGVLEDYYFVVFSRVADDMTESEQSAVGFFTETMSCAIQVTGSDGDGLSLQSALVAGVKEPGAKPHDSDMVNKMAANLGVDYEGKSATEIIDSPLLIHKSLMPNGVVDLVKLWDQLSGGDSFFGQAKPVQDYGEYKKHCQQLEQSFEPRVREIISQLIKEASALASPEAATRRLHELSEHHMVLQAMIDPTINPRVFGATAATYIEQARFYHELGYTNQASQAIKQAQATARSFSCPAAWVNSEANAKAEAIQGSSDETASRVPDNIRCIKCAKVSPKQEVVSASSWRCPHCKYEVDICTGSVKHKSEPQAELKKLDLIKDKTARLLNKPAESAAQAA